jgi:beta-phosphoglucomutase
VSSVNGASLRAILFDLDGVIIDSEHLHEESLRLAGRSFGFEVTAEEDALFRGSTEEAEIDYLLTKHSHLELTRGQVMARKQELYDQMLDRLSLIDGVAEFIDHCQRCGLLLGVATSAQLENQQRAFDRFDLAPYFRTVVTSRDVTNSKPHPEPYATAAQRLGVAPLHCLVIEDSVNGVRSGKGAGCRVAAITTTFERADLVAAGADVVVSSFAELQRWLDTTLCTAQQVEIERRWR